MKSAEARRNSVLANTQAEIANARATLQAAEARVAALEGSGINQAREALRLAQLSYRAGKSSLLELLDAQQAYASTQGVLIAARRARADAQATLTRQAATANEADITQCSMGTIQTARSAARRVGKRGASTCKKRGVA